MATFARDGRTIGYQIHGAGPAILAFHGTTQSANAWDQVREAMDVDRTWVSFEFPGSGESSMPVGPIELDTMAHDSLALMASLGHESFHVVGYSLGAVTALRVASIAPERVSTVTSLCGWSRTDARMRATFDLWRRLIAIGPDLFMRYAIVDGYTASTIEVLEPMIDAAAAMASAAVQPGSDAHLDLDQRIDIDSHLDSITCPALIIGGIEDRWVDISKSRELAGRISRAELVELPAGHLVIGELAPAVASHIARHTTR